MGTAWVYRLRECGAMSTTRPNGSRSERDRGVPRTRLAGVWVASVLFALVLLLLLIFILQNTQPAAFNFFGVRANRPVGVALLLAAVFGILLVALPGTARIVQLRILARRRGEQTRRLPAPDVETSPPPAPPAAPSPPAQTPTPAPPAQPVPPAAPLPAAPPPAAPPPAAPPIAEGPTIRAAEDKDLHPRH